MGRLGVSIATGILAVAALALAIVALAVADDKKSTQAQRGKCSTALRADRTDTAKKYKKQHSKGGSDASPKTRSKGRAARARRTAAGRRARQASERGAAVPQPVDVQGRATEGLAQLTYPFARDREPMLRHQTFRLPEGLPASLVRVVAINDVQTGAGKTFPISQVSGQVVDVGQGRLVTVAVCLEPDGVGPGTYSGGVLVGRGERVAPVTVSATLQDTRWGFVVLAALIGGIAGLGFKLFADKRAEWLPDALLKNVWSPRFAVALGAMFVTGLYSYLTIYADDSTFDANLANLWRVTAETFAGTVAAKAITDLAGRPSPSRGEVNADAAPALDPHNA